MTTPNEGVNDTGSTVDDATNLFLSRWQDADNEPSGTVDEGDNVQKGRKAEDDATDLDLLDAFEQDDDEADTSDEDSDGSDTDQKDAPPVAEASDDHVVKLTVDGEEKAVSVKELKRLYGQEASLTRKSQEVAAARKAADADAERYMVASQKLIEKAQARFQPFANIDWMVAQRRLDDNEFAALRKEAQESYADLQFLQNEADSVLSQIKTERNAALAEAAKESIKVLEETIPGWNREVYDKVRTFAVDRGMDPEVVSSIVDPSAIAIIHDAMSYAELRAKAAAKKKAKTTAKASPKRVVKPSSGNTEIIGRQGVKSTESLAQLRKTGSKDDAANAFLSRWEEARGD